MDMRYIDGRSFLSSTTGTKDEDGNWLVNVVMTETIVYPNGQVREEAIQAFKKDKNFDIAHKAAMQEILQNLQDVVYTPGFDSLVEGIDYLRNLETEDDANSQADEITPA